MERAAAFIRRERQRRDSSRDHRIYFRDPNFYPIEITLPLRKLDRLDATDAALTVEAAVELETAGRFDTIESMWKRKAELVQQRMSAA